MDWLFMIGTFSVFVYMVVETKQQRFRWVKRGVMASAVAFLTYLAHSAVKNDINNGVFSVTKTIYLFIGWYFITVVAPWGIKLLDHYFPDENDFNW